MQSYDINIGSKAVYGAGMDGSAVSIQLPEEFRARMRRQLGDELPAFLHALDEEPLQGFLGDFHGFLTHIIFPRIRKQGLQCFMKPVLSISRSPAP